MRKFLLFLSKTDTSVIEKCSEATKNSQASLGFFVLLTGVLAFISGSLAVSNLFINADAITGKPQMAVVGWLFSGIIGLVYATLIMAIDREIVAASTKWAVVLRIPLAIIISLVISVPIELQLFDARITKRLVDNMRIENQQMAEKVHQKMVPFESRRDTLQSIKNAALRDRTNWGNIMDIEVVGTLRDGKQRPAGKGNAYNSAKSNKEVAEILINRTDSELVKIQQQIAGLQTQTDSTVKVDRIGQSYDLLSKYTALQEVKMVDKTGAASTMSLGITLLFLLFELIPSIMKLLLPKSEYDILIDIRRNLNINTANKIFNEANAEYNGLNIDSITARNPVIIKKVFQSQGDVAPNDLPKEKAATSV
jgi:hypothetical protein